MSAKRATNTSASGCHAALCGGGGQATYATVATLTSPLSRKRANQREKVTLGRRGVHFRTPPRSRRARRRAGRAAPAAANILVPTSFSPKDMPVSRLSRTASPSNSRKTAVSATMTRLEIVSIETALTRNFWRVVCGSGTQAFFLGRSPTIRLRSAYPSARQPSSFLIDRGEVTTRRRAAALMVSLALCLPSWEIFLSAQPAGDTAVRRPNADLNCRRPPRSSAICGTRTALRSRARRCACATSGPAGSRRRPPRMRAAGLHSPRPTRAGTLSSTRIRAAECWRSAVPSTWSPGNHRHLYPPRAAKARRRVLRQRRCRRRGVGEHRSDAVVPTGTADFPEPVMFDPKQFTPEASGPQAAATPPPVHVPNQAAHLLDWLSIVTKHRRLAGALFVVTVGVMMAQAYSTIPMYRAKSQILIQDERSTAISSLNASDPSFWQDPEPYDNTQYRILQSRGLARRVVKRLELQNVPEFNGTMQSSGGPLAFVRSIRSTAGGLARRAFKAVTGGGEQQVAAPEADESEQEAALVGGFLSRVRVEPVRGTRLVDIYFESVDPAFAARAADTLAEEYVQQNLELKLGNVQKSLGWLEEELKRQQQKITLSETALTDYRSQQNAPSLDSRQNIVVAQAEPVERRGDERAHEPRAEGIALPPGGEARSQERERGQLPRRRPELGGARRARPALDAGAAEGEPDRPLRTPASGDAETRDANRERQAADPRRSREGDRAAPERVPRGRGAGAQPHELARGAEDVRRWTWTRRARPTRSWSARRRAIGRCTSRFSSSRRSSASFGTAGPTTSS